MAQSKQKLKPKPKPQQPLAHADYETRVLTPKDIPAFTALQKRMKPALAKPHHLKPKDSAYLRSHLKAGMRIVGSFHVDGTLAAATILADPSSAVSQLGEYPVKDLTTKTIVFQSFMIDPAHQGKGLSHRLDDMARELYPYANFMAKIATDNQNSLDSFVGRRGFEILEEVDSLDVRNNVPYRAVFVFRASESKLLPVCSVAAQADIALPTQNA